MEDNSSKFLYLLSIVFIILLILTFFSRSLGAYRLFMLTIPIAALIGFIIIIRLLAIPSDIQSNSRTRRSERPPKRSVIELVEKEIQCAFCGEKFRITEEMQYCRYCGEIIPRCRVCGSPIVHGDEILQCPYCKAYAHKTHLIEWIKVKGHCPVCGVDVEESKDFPAELLEETKTIISEDGEEDEIISLSDEEQRCASCG